LQKAYSDRRTGRESLTDEYIMKIVYILFILLFYFVSSFGQQNNLSNPSFREPTRKEAEIDARNHHCMRRSDLSFSARLKNYPFNLSGQIQLVSFMGHIDTVKGAAVLRSDSLPRLNDTICYSKLSEIKTLTFAQVDKLTDVLYNYGYSGKIYLGSEPLCYDPKNAILFLDKDGKPFAFIEICFECGKTRVSSENISLGEMCDQKLSMLRDIFNNAGIEYGITKGLIAGN
jgi:hypothetical protein